MACPGIRKGGGGENLKGFFFAFQFFKGCQAQKIAEIIIFPTEKVAKYRRNSLKFALMTLFFCFSISRGGCFRPLGSTEFEKVKTVSTGNGRLLTYYDLYF